MTDSPRSHQRLAQAAQAVRTFACAPASGVGPSASVPGRQRIRQLHATETRLLYENLATGVVATVLIALPLAYIELSAASPRVVAAWLMVVLAVAAARLAIARRYWRAPPDETGSPRWNALFVAGTALAAAGWGAAGVLFYDSSEATDGTFLIFVLGGVMLGGSSLLAARPEAFLTFLLPIGLLSALRLASEGDREHVTMAFLALVFTAATVATTWRFHATIASSLKLRFDNLDLIENLQAAKDHAEALNRDLELRVRDRTARLIEADRRKDEFLATLAHELRNPLAPIRFALETLKDATSTAPAARARDVLDRQVSQLVRLVDDLLDVSRMTTNKMVLRREPHEVGRLMAMAVESILPLARSADHTVTVDPPAASVVVDGDGARLVQVFANVLNNAVKFTPRGGHIWFTAEPQAGAIAVRIRDTGMGIAADVLPRVFDLFEQAEPILERTAGGLGIGLTLARRLVEMHDGRIEIRSPGTGQGTEVEIRLPTTPAPRAEAAAPERPAAAAARRLRVLIVEDSVDAAEMLEVAVSQLGHTTRIAHDGATAIGFAGEYAPDVILLDIGLPMMSGYAVAGALRARPEFDHVHIAAVTGWGHDEDRRRAREAGFDSHFTKPLTPSVLEDFLATIAHGPAPLDGPPRPRTTDSGSAV